MDRPEITIYEDTDYEGNPIRVYDGGSSWQSATYVDEARKYELVFNYMRRFDLVFQLREDISRILLIGGAGFAYPKYVIAHHPDAFIDVVDSDPMAYETARRFFYLQDLIDEFSLNENHRLNSITDDGLHYIRNSTQKYDVIINDAYCDLEPAYELLTAESTAEIKNCLNDQGIYVLNLSADRKFRKTEYFMKMLKTLQQVYRHVLVTEAFTFKYTRVGNYVIFCSDHIDHCEGMLEYDAGDAETVTGDNIKELQEQFRIFAQIQ